MIEKPGTKKKKFTKDESKFHYHKVPYDTPAYFGGVEGRVSRLEEEGYQVVEQGAYGATVAMPVEEWNRRQADKRAHFARTVGAAAASNNMKVLKEKVVESQIGDYSPDDGEPDAIPVDG